MHEKTCLYCPKPVARTRRTCGSSSCRDADGYAWLQDRRARSTSRPRPERRTAFTSTYRLEIHEQSGWTCHICGYDIDPDALYPSIDAAVVDHVIPLAKGGTNDRTNLASAHSYCNLVKGRRLLADVM
ncbi:HNH endonuclease [Terrabacter sp. C0L_2]|uniref:HNH endonuclease n=1 Tax=Terrabacter sp. C0L_2 TaxID=3108389 RepID=UPI002ED15374|nr:HNH endonuclease signature motif containing protein [Terrabacter sp. C0L_2]